MIISEVYEAGLFGIKETQETITKLNVALAEAVKTG